MSSLILASSSKVRQSLLQNAGLVFDIKPARLDERAIEKPLIESDFNAGDIADVLSTAKALQTSEANPGALVIGADQTLSFSQDPTLRLNKPKTVEEARAQLLLMRGKTHTLHSAVSIAKEGAVIWQHLAEAHLTMRDFSPVFAGRYLSQIGEKALSSVGCYQLEGPGIQLFEKIDGDYFTILGLPMLPLLAELRKLGVIDQ